MDGLATLARLRERQVDAQVVLISGHGNIESAVRAIKMGAFDFVEKPLSLDKTVLVVAQRAAPAPPRSREPRAARARRSPPDDGRRELRDAPAARAGRDGGADQRPRADLRRERHRQGAGRAHHPRAQPPPRGAVRRGQLRGDSRRADRERAVRPRARRVHRRGRRSPRQVRGGRRRHDLPRRDRRHEPEDAGQGAARAAGADDGGGRRHDSASRSTRACWRRPTRICRRRSAPAGSARICISA